MNLPIVCPECGVPLVPFGGEDVCISYCDSCGGHDCHCYEDDGADTGEVEECDYCSTSKRHVYHDGGEVCPMVPTETKTGA